MFDDPTAANDFQLSIETDTSSASTLTYDMYDYSDAD